MATQLGRVYPLKAEQKMKLISQGPTLLLIISNILHQTKQFIMGLQGDYWNASYKKKIKNPNNKHSKTDFDTVTAFEEAENTKSGKNLRAHACLHIIIFLQIQKLPYIYYNRILISIILFLSHIISTYKISINLLAEQSKILLN